MKIGIYSPYLDTAGGGEKYILTIAEGLSVTDKVDVLLDQNLNSLDVKDLKDKNESRHNLDLSLVNFVSAPLGQGSSFFERNSFLKKYDVLFYLTDGSVFYSTAKKSFIHFQVPFQDYPLGLWGRIKISSFKKAVYNSNFTRQVIEKSWPIKNGQVVYPPVDVTAFSTGKKKKQILTVGRLFGFNRPKKQDVMIKAFIELVKENNLIGWSFILAGGMLEGDKVYVEELKKISQGYPIKILPNLEFNDLVKLYTESAIYWHATGFGETDPARMEHFGITTVEAMASGCVPVVINKGGQIEIVTNNDSGLLWDTTDQLKELTMKLTKDQALVKKLSSQAIARSKNFSKEKFIETIKEVIEQE